LADEQIGLEVNSAAARSQLQLHIHIDCLRSDLPALLQTYEHVVPDTWVPFMLEDHQYQLMRLTGADLGARNPFKLAAAMSPFAATAMGAQSLLLAGAASVTAATAFTCWRCRSISIWASAAAPKCCLIINVAEPHGAGLIPG